jgi:hypothetical protein
MVQTFCWSNRTPSFNWYKETFRIYKDVGQWKPTLMIYFYQVLGTCPKLAVPQRSNASCITTLLGDGTSENRALFLNLAMLMVRDLIKLDVCDCLVGCNGWSHLSSSYILFASITQVRPTSISNGTKYVMLGSGGVIHCTSTASSTSASLQWLWLLFRTILIHHFVWLLHLIQAVTRSLSVIDCWPWCCFTAH